MRTITIPQKLGGWTKEIALGYGYKVTSVMNPNDQSFWVSVDSLVGLLKVDRDEFVSKYGCQTVKGRDYQLRVISLDVFSDVICDLADQGNNAAKLIQHSTLSYLFSR